MKTKSRWPIYQADIDERLTVGGEPVPQFFIEDGNGEGRQLVGSAKNISVAADNLRGYMAVAIESLLSGGGDDLESVTLTLHRIDMTDEEVEALPEI